MPPFGIPFPASTSIKPPVFDLKNSVFSFSKKNKALKCPLIHELILIRAISLAPVRCGREAGSLLPPPSSNPSCPIKAIG